MTTPTTTDPRLSDVLAPAFADCSSDDVGDAMLKWGYLTGKLSESWAHPTNPVTIQPGQFGDLLTAANGLHAVARVVQVLSNEDGGRRAAPRLSDGLLSAICALSRTLNDDLYALSGQ